MEIDRLRNRKKFKFNKFSYLLILLILLGVGYAVLQVGYSFNGTANIAAASFRLHLENLSVKNGSVVAKSPATIDDTDKLKVSFAIELNELNSFYEFEVDLVNDSGTDAQVTSVNLNGIPNDLKKYFIYRLTYSDDTNISVGDIIPKKDKKRIKVLIKFSDTEDLAGILGASSGLNNPSFNLSFLINYSIAGGGSVNPSTDTLIKQLKLEENAVSDISLNYGILNENGLYKLNSSSNIYYYRGNVVNNNVLFADMCWKMVRTTEAGGIKLIYNGLPTNGVCDSINVSIGNGEFNTVKNNARYVGYMYNDNLNVDSVDENVNSTNSNVKTLIDAWYNDNLASYTDYLEDAVWCNDRESTSGTVFAGSDTRELLGTNPNPEIRDSLVCTRNIDKFTVSAINGNGQLDYPVGLLTADEVLIAGNGINGGTTYLNSNGIFWTMTPLQFASRKANNFVLYDDGIMDGGEVSELYDIRPAIVLKNDLVLTSGDGTVNNPYVISKSIPVPEKKESIIQNLKLDSSAINDSSVNFGDVPTTSDLYVRNDTTGDDYPIYYYRGNVLNNNVLFANTCWKIVRTTEAGGTKLIYNGEPSNGQCNNTGSSTQIAVSSFNTTQSNAKYVGYMFNTNFDVTSTDANINTSDSTIKDVLETWYRDNLSSYTDYLEDAIWCNDRESSSGTIFAAMENRDLLGTSPIPEIRDSKVCTRSIDRFTNYYDNGNGKLSYPIGLLTADEILSAGNGINGGTTYLNSGITFWTMTPSQFASRKANNFVLYDDGVLDGGEVADENGVRPSIVLKVGVKVTGGNGTSNSPYIVE